MTSTHEDDRRRARRRFIVVVVGASVLSLAALAAAAVGAVRDEVTEAVRGAGAGAPAAFVSLYVAASLLFVPGSLLALVAGVLFGAVEGSLYTLAGGLLSAGAGYAVGRRLGRDQLVLLAGDRLDKVDRWLARHGVVTVAVARNVPAGPFGLVNYAAGITAMPLRLYLAGTLLGLIPGTVAFAMFGSSLHEPLSGRFFVSLGLLALVLAGGLGAQRLLDPAGR